MEILNCIKELRRCKPIPFKSQKGQDKWVINEILKGKKNGYFSDVAAADGLTNSNTYALEKAYGWNGICIEANPLYFKTLSEVRNCICEKEAISSKKEKVRFRIDNGQLGGIVAEDTDNSEDIRGNELGAAAIMTIQATTLKDVLDKHDAPKIIDYFSLDVEGAEERIISSFDFDAYQFRCITIERPTALVNEILFKNDYIFVKNFQFDTFYVHADIKRKYNIACEPFEQVPPKKW